MKSFAVEIRASAEKELRKIRKDARDDLIDAMLALGKDPRPHGYKQLTNEAECRNRKGYYRILYVIDDILRIVFSTAVGHRKDIYRKR